MWGFPLFPEQASTVAGQIDLLYFALVGLSLIFAGILPFVVLYLIVRYHRSMKADRSNPINSSLKLELTWSIIPFILSMGVFFWSTFLFFQINADPDDPLEIYVIGKQWMWHLQHPNGKRENNELHVPVGQPIKLIMTSQDVIHSFYIPAFRLKKDVVPGRYTTMWFEPTKTGEYHLFCAEYCGTEHSAMIGRVVVLPLPDYQRWLTTEEPAILPDGSTISTGVSSDSGGSMAEIGAQVFQQQGCVSCHRTDSAARAPVLNNIFGKPTSLASGETLTVDEEYLRESILRPQAKITVGYGPIMPTFEGQLTEDQVLQLIAYIKSLSDVDANEENQ